MELGNAVPVVVGAFGGLLWAGLTAAPVTYADARDYTIFPPGEVELTDQQEIGVLFGNLPGFRKEAFLDSYQVSDDGSPTATFDVRLEHMDYLQNGQIPTLGIGAYKLNWLFPMGHQIHEEIINGTGSAADYDGSVHDVFQWALNLDRADHPLFMPPMVDYPTFVVFGHEYWETPLGSAEYVTILNMTFPLFDTFPATVPTTAEATGAGLGLAGLFLDTQ